MADTNIKRTPLGASGYRDWSQNVMPFLQAMVDVKKYKMAKSDEARKLALTYGLSGGLGSIGGPVEYGGVQMQPYTVEERMALSGKDVDALKALSEVDLNQAKLKESNIALSYLGGQGQGGDMGGWTPQWISAKTPGGSTIELQPPSQRAKPSGLAGFFQNRAAQAPTGPRLSSNQQKLMARAKALRPDLDNTMLLRYLMSRPEWNE